MREQGQPDIEFARILRGGGGAQPPSAVVAAERARWESEAESARPGQLAACHGNGARSGSTQPVLAAAPASVDGR